MRPPDFLYELLPTIYRQGDLSRDTPLRALFAILQEQYDLLESDIATLYDNWFVETCDPWALPYLADLLGAERGLRHDVRGIDAHRLIANTLAYRRRKGIVSTLEHVAEDATGWPVRVVEGSDLVAMTETGRRLRSHARGAISMRDIASLDRLGGPFDIAGRTAQVRLNGLSNLDRVGIFLWRLQSYPVRAVTAAKVTGGQGRFTFHPLGHDMPLFNRRLGSYGIARRNGMRNVPAPLSRRLLADELGRNAVPQDDCFLSGKQPAFAIHLADAAKPEALQTAELAIGDLSHWHRGDAAKDARAIVDPERGRLMLLREEDCRRDLRVLTDHCYGFAGDIGGGPYFQPATPFAAASITAWRARVGAAAAGEHAGVLSFGSLDDALRAWTKTNQDGIIEIADSGTYRLGGDDPNIAFAGNRRSLTIQTAPHQRPCVEGLFVIDAKAPAAKVTLDGLLIGGAIHTAGALQLTLRHCTVVPTHGHIAILADADRSDGLRVALQSSITGALRLPADAAELRISDCIVDGGNLRAVAAPERASEEGDGELAELRRAGPPAVVARTTFIGTVVVAEIQASDTIFIAPLAVVHRHQGFVRHSYLAAGSHTPQRYECHPESQNAEEPGGAADAAANAPVRPIFTSLRFGHPGYAQLAQKCPRDIRAGASNGAEMGAFNVIDDARREDNLRDMLDEHLPVGHRPVTIYVT
jgi:hypothetical protein